MSLGATQKKLTKTSRPLGRAGGTRRTQTTHRGHSDKTNEDEQAPEQRRRDQEDTDLSWRYLHLKVLSEPLWMETPTAEGLDLYHCGWRHLQLKVLICITVDGDTYS
ncbi:hypothetical protein CHS0354_007222 [Potamilus streckersoni]|uniref:Uncharacterized protein n=1 Tax=Potamilus streckersoni TaxID=2493646 RepID=A0AAE0VLA8_9BIVA|nr:hypothetical protein CHS0354_007222 [Potamilus streckersoni]